MHSFFLYSGAGNTFYLFDNRLREITEDLAPLWAQFLCKQPNRHSPADGLVLLEPSTRADYRMRIFNSDGSEAEMCGNGLRCLVQFIADLKLEPHSPTIETMERLLSTKRHASTISTEMGEARILHWGISEKFQEHTLQFHLIHTGVPHFVWMDPKGTLRPFLQLAKQLRTHSLAGVKGANVNWIQPIAEKKYAIRTFERGVEAETQACGTGAVAAAIAVANAEKISGPLTFLTASGLPIVVHYSQCAPPFGTIFLEGPVSFCTLLKLSKNSIERKPSDTLD